MQNNCETKSSCKEKMMLRIKGMIPELIGITLGAIGGGIYYFTVGCSSGSCPITSNPFMSVLWGAMIGFLTGGLFNNKKLKK